VSQATLFYDRDCGFCRWAAAKVATWDRHRLLRLVPLQDEAAADSLLGSMDQSTRMASWHLVTDDGAVHSGGRGFGPLLRMLPGGSVLAWLTEVVQPLTDVTYRFVAGHRPTFSRLVPRRAKERADERLRRRR
jgi:predicted DCC family thiol-disulfide oxidoreductase YuxK